MSAKKLHSVLLLVVSFFILQSSYAQDKTVSGKITDSKDGTPIIGASIQAKGSRIGTTSKTDGTFSLTFDSKITTLVISSIGYETQEVTVSGAAVAVSMVASAGTSLNEVVVIGYGGTAKKRSSPALMLLCLPRISTFCHPGLPTNCCRVR